VGLQHSLFPNTVGNLVTAASNLRMPVERTLFVDCCHIVDSFQALIEYPDSLSAQAAKMVRAVTTFVISSLLSVQLLTTYNQLSK